LSLPFSCRVFVVVAAGVGAGERTSISLHVYNETTHKLLAAESCSHACHCSRAPPSWVGCRRRENGMRGRGKGRRCMGVGAVRRGAAPRAHALEAVDGAAVHPARRAVPAQRDVGERQIGAPRQRVQGHQAQAAPFGGRIGRGGRGAGIVVEAGDVWEALVVDERGERVVGAAEAAAATPAAQGTQSGISLTSLSLSTLHEDATAVERRFVMRRSLPFAYEGGKRARRGRGGVGGR